LHGDSFKCYLSNLIRIAACEIIKSLKLST